MLLLINVINFSVIFENFFSPSEQTPLNNRQNYGDLELSFI